MLVLKRYALFQVLPQRVQKSGNGPPPWAVVVRKTLIEEGHSTPQLLIIFELIVTHSDLFYESRDLFVPQMVNALPRLGSAPAATAEMKKVGSGVRETGGCPLDGR